MISMTISAKFPYHALICFWDVMKITPVIPAIPNAGLDFAVSNFKYMN